MCFIWSVFRMLFQMVFFLFEQGTDITIGLMLTIQRDPYGLK